MRIIKATVLIGRGGDKILLDTDLPCPYVPAFSPSQTPLQLEFQATCGDGVEYVRKHFNLEPEVINVG